MLPVVWILGASGAGKSTVGFQVARELGGIGVLAAFVDADQLRLALGVNASETQLIASGLPLIEREFRAHGAHVLVVSGIVDDVGHLAKLLAGLQRPRLLTVHLDVDAETLRERIRRRGYLLEQMEANVQYAAHIDPHLADLRLATTARSPTELASVITAEVLAFLRMEPTGSRDEDADIPTSEQEPRQVTMISGPGGVGLSTVGYSTYSRVADSGRPTGYVDAHQLGFLGADSRAEELAPMRAANVRAITGNFTRSGAEAVIVTGEVRTIRLLSDRWNSSNATLVWLDASPDTLAERITLRARGVGSGIPGDHRIGLTGSLLSDAIAAAIVERDGSALLPAGTLIVDTSALSALQIAETIADIAADRRRT